MSMSTVLRGPADADHYRVKVGRWGDRWYTDPLPACDIAPVTDAVWPSVTFVKKATGGDWTYVALKRIARELRDNPAALDGLDFKACYDRLISINKIGLGRDGDRGTMVHTYLERALRGQPITEPWDPADGVEWLPAVQAFLDTYQPELVASELVCINRDLNGVGYGGTADALIRIEGDVYLPDWKSRGAESDHGAYPEEAAQLGAYAMADYYIAEGPCRMRLPVDVAGGLIVSIKPDGYRIFPIDLDKASTWWAELHRFWVARRSEKDAIGKPWAPRAVQPTLSVVPDPSPTLVDLIATSTSVDNLTALWQARQGEWTEQHTALAAARKAEILGGAA